MEARKAAPDAVGLLGGTFDPVHRGHLALAEAARARAGLHRVIFLPSRCPPHRDARELTPFRHRLAMAEIALAEHPSFLLSAAEADLSCPSRVGDALRQVRRLLGPARPCYFLAGADVLGDVARWEATRIAPGEVRFLVASRPGHEASEALEAVPPCYRPHVETLDAILPAVSGTEVRQRLAEGGDTRDLLPETVAAYIRRHGLYGRA